MRILSFFLTITGILWLSIIYGQKPSISFQHLKPIESYSESTTRFIREDSWGYLWIGSEEGLNKFDGDRIIKYRAELNNLYSLSHNDTKESMIDKKGNLWVATRSGLNLYDPVYDRFYNHRSHKYICFKYLESDIEDIAEDEYGNIWASAGDDGLYKISSLTTRNENFSFNAVDNSSKLYGIASDYKGSLWVGTRNGLLKFNLKTNQFEDLKPIYGEGYQIKDVWYESEYDRIWLCTTEGLKIIDQKNNTFKEYQHNRFDNKTINGNYVAQVVPYGNQTYLIAIDGGGVDYFDLRNEKFYHYTMDNEGQLSSNNVTYIYKDSRNSIWAGTFMNGVDYSTDFTNRFSMVKNNPLSESALKKGIVTNFLKDKSGNLWVSTDGGGLYVKRKGKEGYEVFNPNKLKYDFTKFPILSLAEDLDGLIWMGTYGGGLISLNPATNQFIILKQEKGNQNSINNDRVRNVLVDDENNIWFNGYYSGVGIYNKKTKKIKHYRHQNNNAKSILSDWVHRVYKDSKGTIWLATFTGLNRYNRDTDDFTAYTFSSPYYASQSINHLLDITECSDGSIWLGTMDGGVISFNTKTAEYKIYSTREGLTNNSAKAIIEDNNNNLWISTNNGVNKLNIITKKIIPYSVLDGIPPYSYYFNAKYKDETGKIYFGNSKGYLMINPDINSANSFIPPIVLTGIKIMGKPLLDYYQNKDSAVHVSFLKEIQLNYSQNDIEINFAALNLINSQRNTFSYILEGFDEDWHPPSSQRYATYTNVSPGTYTFRVKGSNNDGIWNEKGASLIIHISAPWWRSWWFMILEAAALLGLLYLIYWLRVRTIRSKNERLEKIVLSRTEELRQSNEQLETFIYKASHDIKGPLRSIIGLTVVGQKDVTDQTSKIYFEHILKSTKKLDKLLADLIELTKVKEATIVKEKINFRELIEEAISKFEHLEGFHEVSINVMVKESIPFYSDRKLLYSIIQNLIENPIKYRDSEKGNCYLDIVVSTEKGKTELKFADNGIGIAPELQDRVFEMFFKASERSRDTGLGLHIVKTSLTKLGGKIALESKSGVGTTFTITFDEHER